MSDLLDDPAVEAMLMRISSFSNDPYAKTNTVKEASKVLLARKILGEVGPDASETQVIAVLNEFYMGGGKSHFLSKQEIGKSIRARWRANTTKANFP